MRNMLSRFALVSMLAVTGLACTQVCCAAGKDSSSTMYNDIISHLDQGGDLLVVANVEGVVEETMESLINGLALASSSGDEATEKISQTLNRLETFMKRNGFYAMTGYGMSVAPRGSDDLNNSVSYMTRDPAAASLPLWLGLIGSEPRELVCRKFLPADTVMARVSSADLKELWRLVRTGVKDVATPEGAVKFESSLAMSAQLTGVNVDQLMDSFGAEGFLSIQLSKDTTVTLPAGPTGGTLDIPTPSLLLCIAITNQTLPDLLNQRIKAMSGPNQPPPVTEQEVCGVKVKSLSFPIPSPIPVQPTFAVKDGFFLLGSSSEVVMNAVRASANGTGLISTPKYKNMAEGLPEKNNGIVYMDSRLYDVFCKVQYQIFEMRAAVGGGEMPEMDAFKKLMGNDMKQEYLFVTVNGKDGVISRGVSSASGRDVVKSLAMAPVGMLAAIAIPSFVRARETSQKNACINNLRLIEAAKDQWALEQGKTNGTPVTIEDIRVYLPRGQMPACPAGGVYDLGVVGKNATCTIPDHELPGPPR